MMSPIMTLKLTLIPYNFQSTGLPYNYFCGKVMTSVMTPKLTLCRSLKISQKFNELLQ